MSRVIYSLYIDIPDRELDLFDKNILRPQGLPTNYYNKKQSAYFKNSKGFINRLFNIPLIFAVALLSFAH